MDAEQTIIINIIGALKYDADCRPENNNYRYYYSRIIMSRVCTTLWAARFKSIAECGTQNVSTECNHIFRLLAVCRYAGAASPPNNGIMMNRNK